MEEKVESEIPAQLPTSGQILGVLVKSLGLDDYRLNSKTAQRYFSGRLENIVKETSRSEIILAVSEALSGLGFQANLRTGEETSASVLAPTIEWHAVHWDTLRTFLLPRMSRVYPSHLADVWKTYLRLGAIDLALKVAAHLHLTKRPLSTLDILDRTSVDRRGDYLNEKRQRAKVSLLKFAELVGMNDNTVEAWLYQGARPRDENLAKIATVLSSDRDPCERETVLCELRMLYWVSDIAGILGKHVGIDAVAEIASRLQEYASQVYRTIEGGSVVKFDPAALVELATRGARSPLAPPLLAELISHESDDRWREDLMAADSDWIGRVLRANFEAHRSEEDALIEKTDGQVLKDWDIGNPEAYEHYRRSMELQIQGRTIEALAEVIKAVELDPLDPANHFTIGSVKGGIGMNNGDDVLVDEGLEACWIASSLDPSWILPWTEIGWLLLGTGRAKEAVEHLQSVRQECGPLDSNYYNALGLALEQLGELVESLAALESSLKLNPNDPRIVADAAVTALKVGDPMKSNRYRKMARHLGFSKELERSLELVKAFKTDLPVMDIARARDQELTALDIAVARRPDDATTYLARGKVHFAMREDNQAISDLDVVLRLDPDNAGVHLLRGIVFGYMKRYDLAIADTSDAIRLDPGNAMAHYYRGLAYGEQDAFDHAIADLSEVVRLSPGYVDAYRARGDTYRYKGECDLAIANYDTAVRLDPDDPFAYRFRGLVREDLGDSAEAENDFRRGRERLPSGPRSVV